MAALPLKSSCTEHFLWAKGHNASAVHSDMRPVYGDECFTRPAILAWCKKFARGRENIDDKKRPALHVVATTNATIATIDKFVRSDRRVSILRIVRHSYFARFNASK